MEEDRDTPCYSTQLVCEKKTNLAFSFGISKSGNFHIVPNCPAAVKATSYTAGPKGTGMNFQEMNTVSL